MIDLAILEINSNILAFLLEKNLIKKTNSCLQCHSHMNLVQYNCLDSYIWRCSNYSCNKRISIRSGIIFENSHLEFKVILSILNFYGFGISPKNCSKMLKIWVATILERYQIFRQAVS